MKIRIIGDIHGDFVAYHKLIENSTFSIQVGDFGKGFSLTPENLPLTHRFIRGNHDDPEACKSDPHWIKDGDIENWYTLKVMFIGGAYSIDKVFRTPGRDWWADEEISLQQMYEIAEKYEKFKPDIMITHDLPSNISSKIFPNHQKIVTKTGSYLESLHLIHQPKYWFAGHWHENKQELIDNTNFYIIGINSYIDLEIGEKHD